MVRFHLAPPTLRPLPRPDGIPDHDRRLGFVKAFRRGLLVAALAVFIGGVIKWRGKGGVPPTSGGWRELEPPDFR